MNIKKKIKKCKPKYLSNKKYLYLLLLIPIFLLSYYLIAGSLVTPPEEEQTTGLATIKVFWYDNNTEISWSNINASLFICNYTGINTDSIIEYINTWENYEEKSLTNNSIYIDKNCIYLLRVNDLDNNSYTWSQLKVGENKLYLNKYPTEMIIYEKLLYFNDEVASFEWDIHILSSDLDILVPMEQRNASIPIYRNNYNNYFLIDKFCFLLNGSNPITSKNQVNITGIPSWCEYLIGDKLLITLNTNFNAKYETELTIFMDPNISPIYNITDVGYYTFDPLDGSLLGLSQIIINNENINLVSPIERT